MPTKQIALAAVTVLLFFTGSASAGGETPSSRGRFLIDEASGLRFAAPDSWIACDKRALREPLLDGRFDKFAARMNIDATELIVDLSGFNLLVAKSNGESIWLATWAGKPRANPAVIHKFQTKEELRKMFAPFGPVRGVEDVNTSVGPGRVVYFSYRKQPQLRSASLHFKISSGVGYLTVTMKTDSEARDLLRKIVPTLEDVGLGRTSPRRRTGCEQYGLPLDVPPAVR